MLTNGNSNAESPITTWKKLNPQKLPEMMRHWYEIKSQYPDYLIAYRMGDFYEFFYDDATKISRLLGLTLTNRGSGPNRHPLAGIPHKATQHFKSLIRLGETVVVVEQMESPETARNEGRIVKRGIIQILSPGTVIDESLLDANNNNYLISITYQRKVFGVAFIDLSCGDFFCAEVNFTEDFSELVSLISRFDPVECILNSEKKLIDLEQKLMETLPNLIIKYWDPYSFQYDNARNQLLKHFNVKSLESFGIESLEKGVCAAGAILDFLNQTQKTVLPNITSIKRYNIENLMYLDSNTQKGLEILHNLQDNSEKNTLLYILNKTITPMGNRYLKKIIVQPLLDLNVINERLNIVEFFKDNPLERNDVREILQQIGDIERIISRINYSRTANARDLVYLKNSLKMIPDLINILSNSSIKAINNLINQLHDYSSIIKLIDDAITDNPPTTITEGGIIRDGYDSRVDEMRDLLNNGKEWILKFEAEQKQRLGLNAGLRVGFNRVLGYYIQITENALKSIKELPSDYIKRQSLKGSTRYDTEKLKEMEIKILNADETIKDVEYEIFSSVRDKVALNTKEIQEDAFIISLIDVLCSFSEVAAKNNYCKPVIKSHKKIIIKDGRHPVVEQINLSEPFIPNDTKMDTDENQLLVITGPNWSGKSTYLRQVALITIMAQIGSFVPASSAEIGIVDRVFTRIGASDDLSRGQSTFLLEMTETAQILNYATEKSLIIIDELGRGTSTTDGKGIAQAVMEYLNKKRIKTLFSTHFHELIHVPLERMKNYHFLIEEEGNKLIFLRKLTEGGTDKSYGIHVALMAGIPKEIVDRAFELVENEEEQDIKFMSNHSKSKELSEMPVTRDQTNLPAKPTSSLHINNNKKPRKNKKLKQSFLFIPGEEEKMQVENNKIVKKLKSLDIDKMTPLEALNLLKKMKEEL